MEINDQFLKEIRDFQDYAQLIMGEKPPVFINRPLTCRFSLPAPLLKVAKIRGYLVIDNCLCFVFRDFADFKASNLILKEIREYQKQLIELGKLDAQE